MFAGILPLFLLILAGFGAVKSGYVAAESMRPIGAFILKIALPALIFSAVSSVPLSEALNAGYLLGYLFGSLIAFGAGLFLMRRYFGMDLATGAIIALGTSLSNSGFMGFPIVLTVVGQQAATLLAQCMLVENIVMIPLALVLSETALAKGDGGWRRAVPTVLSGVLRNPIVVAVLAAFAFNLSGLPMPTVTADAIDLLAHVASPTALFVIGGTVASLPLAGVYRRVSVIVTAKLVFHPLMVFLMLSLLPGVSDTARIGGTLFAAVPMLSVYPIFGQRVGMELVTATAQMVATVASFLTLALAVWLLAG